MDSDGCWRGFHGAKLGVINSSLSLCAKPPNHKNPACATRKAALRFSVNRGFWPESLRRDRACFFLSLGDAGDCVDFDAGISVVVPVLPFYG